MSTMLTADYSRRGNFCSWWTELRANVVMVGLSVHLCKCLRNIVIRVPTRRSGL